MEKRTQQIIRAKQRLEMTTRTESERVRRGAGDKERRGDSDDRL